MTTNYERWTSVTARDVTLLLEADGYIPEHVLIVGTGPNPIEGQIFQDAWPSCCILGIEAYEDLCERANRLFYTIHAAVVREPHLSTVTLYRRRGMPIASSLWSRPEGKNSRVRVPAITLDSVADKRNLIGTAVFLWMDCEGSELNALRGAHSLLASVRWIHLEVTPRPERSGWPSAIEIQTWLKRNDYHLVRSHARRGRSKERHDRTYRKHAP